MSKECRPGAKRGDSQIKVQSKWSKAKATSYCTVCSKAFKCTRARNVHMTKKHKQTASTEVSEEPTNECMATCKKSNNTKTMAIKCSMCDKSFSSRQRLTLYIRGTHKY